MMKIDLEHMLNKNNIDDVIKKYKDLISGIEIKNNFNNFYEYMIFLKRVKIEKGLLKNKSSKL